MHIVGGVQSSTLYYELQKWGAGVIAVPAHNPDGIEVPRDFDKSIMLDPGTPLVSDMEYTAIAKFFIDALGKLADSGQLKGYRPDNANEAAVLHAVADDNSHTITGVPEQVIGSARVALRRDGNVMNILTGEMYEAWPPPGYNDNGDTHSHNTMGAFFSGVDNRDDQGIPGRHLVFGSFRHNKKTNLWTWDIACSVIANYSRYQKVFATTNEGIVVRQMQVHDLMDPAYNEAYDYHPKIWDNVKIHVPKSFPKDERKQVHRLPASVGVPSWGWNEYEKMYEEQARRMRAELDRQDDPFPQDFGWMDDLLTVMPDGSDPPKKEAPGQGRLFDLADTEDDDQAELVCRPIDWIRDELEGMLDAIDNVMRMAPDEEHGLQIVARLLNGTGLFCKIKPKKIGGSKKK